MAFDVNGARAAGWTDPEILAFMRKPLRKMALTTPGDWSPVGRAPAPAAPFVGPRATMNAPPPESTFQGTMGRIGAEGYQGPQYTGGPLQIGQPPDVGNAIGAVENIPGYGDQRGLGLSQGLRFGMEASAPLLGPAAAARPLSTLMGLGYGMAAQHGVESGLTSLGVQPGYAQLAGDVAGLGAGVAAGVAPWERMAKPGAFPEFVRNELGEIVIRPSQGWTSTLRDLIEQKVPAKVQPAQLRGILSQASPEEVKWSRFGHVPIGQATEEMAAGKFKNFGLDKGVVLSELQGPEIQESLRTPPDTKFGNYTLPGGEQSHELLFQLPQQPGKAFESGHWGVPNVVAHSRFNERTTPTGEKVLFLEELQSDWHQKGRKEGYQTGGREESQAKLRRDAARAHLESLRPAHDAGQLPEGEFARSYEAFNQADQAWQNTLGSESGKVPPAPFAKDWHELVMKRMIGEAINKGAKKLAWTTGEQQAARYDLSKHIDKLEYNPRSRHLEAWDPQGRQVVQKEGVNPEELPEYIGQEAAKKLQRQIDEFDTDILNKDDFDVSYDHAHQGFVITDPNGKKILRPDGSGWAAGDAYREIYRLVDHQNIGVRFPSLSGLDLKTGGEGMKGFYDKILPDFARKYGKKFGSTVSQTEIQTPAGPVSVHSLDITPEMVRALKGGQPMFGTQIKQQK